MSESVRSNATLLEDKRLDRLPETAKGAVRKLDGPLDAAKKRAGNAVRAAVGDDPVRVYADEGLMSRVMGGPGIPDYLARIVSNEDALRRYALSLLRGDRKVRVRTVIEVDEEIA